jgi:hypothetical protein
MQINSFLHKYVTGPVDYLSVDIEGLDLEVLQAMDPAFQPTIIQCEHERKIDQLSEILSHRGYGLLGMTDVNVGATPIQTFTSRDHLGLIVSFTAAHL